MKILVIAAAMAVSAPCWATDWSLTKEQEDRANLLGSADSPVAFLQTCSFAIEPLPADAQAEYDKANKDEKEQIDILRAITAQGCASVIRAVAETVVAGAPYKVEGSIPVCVDPKMEIRPLLQRWISETKQDQTVAEQEGMTTALFILRKLHEDIPCKS